MADKEDAAAKGATHGVTAKLTSAEPRRGGSNDDAVKRLRMLFDRAATPIGTVELQKTVTDILRALGHADAVEVPENVNGEPVNAKGEVISREEAERLVAEEAQARIDAWEADQARLREEADRVAKAVEDAEAERAAASR